MATIRDKMGHCLHEFFTMRRSREQVAGCQRDDHRFPDMSQRIRFGSAWLAGSPEKPADVRLDQFRECWTNRTLRRNTIRLLDLVD